MLIFRNLLVFYLVKCLMNIMLLSINFEIPIRLFFTFLQFFTLIKIFHEILKFSLIKVICGIWGLKVLVASLLWHYFPVFLHIQHFCHLIRINGITSLGTQHRMTILGIFLIYKSLELLIWFIIPVIFVEIYQRTLHFLLDFGLIGV